MIQYCINVIFKHLQNKMHENNINWIKQHFKRVEAVFFDFDNTLVDENYSVRNRWDITLTKYQDMLNNSKLKETFFKIYAEKGFGYKFHIDDTLDRLNLSKDYKKSIINDFLGQPSNSESVYPHAVELLKLLKRMNFKLAIFTNG